MRKLASIRVISALDTIEGADKIELATLDGWKCVVKKGEFSVGTKAVYFELDSILPSKDERYSFLSNQFKDYTCEPYSCEDGYVSTINGVRIKTVVIRGQISQGLALPLSMFSEVSDLPEGTDVTKELGVRKYEEQESIEGDNTTYEFPTFIRKTTQERIQNVYTKLLPMFEVTQKLNGSSMTVFLHNGEFGVCSRNKLLPEDRSDFWAMVRKYQLKEYLEHLSNDKYFNWDIAIQGELIGGKIQSDYEKVGELDFFIYDIYNIRQGTYLSPEHRRNLIYSSVDVGFELKHVPVLDTRFDISNYTLAELLDYADGPSVLNDSVAREGLVFKENCDTNRKSFKIISNAYLKKSK